MTADYGAGLEPPAPLLQLADSYGVETAYTDIDGRVRRASTEALLAVLRCLGAELDGPEDASEALARRIRRRWRRPVPPVAAARDGEAAWVELRSPSAPHDFRPGLELHLEDGSVRPVAAGPETLLHAGAEERAGRVRHRYRLTLPSDLPWGYHRLLVEDGGRRAGCLVIRAPARTWRSPDAPGWGAFLPLYALRTGRCWGIGDFTDLEALQRWIGSRGGRLVGTLPLLSAFLSRPFDPSPYAPASRLFWNEAYVDPVRAPGWGEEALERETPLPGGVGALESDLRALRAREDVRYGRVAAVKRRVLERLARRFFEGGAGDAGGYQSFLRDRPRAVDYARFRATAERRGEPWTDWPERLRGGDLRPGDSDPAAVKYHLFAQWVAETQLAALAREAPGNGCGLYLDLPLGAHPDGFDTWREAGAFARGASVGAPPDDFFAAGQDWGFPPLHPERSRERGYGYVRDSLRHSMRHAAVLRIDHVMSLHRLFWVPWGMEAREGVYVRYRPDELYAILCLESHRMETEVVGEDLGTVPDAVGEAMARNGVLGMSVLQFELGPHVARDGLPRGRPDSLAMLNTHDMYPFAAYWRAVDIEERLELGYLDPAEAAAERTRRRETVRSVEAALRGNGPFPEGASAAGAALEECLRHLAAGPSRFLMVNLEDLWLETRPQNLPGTAQGPANWRRKARLSLEEMRESPRVGARLDLSRRVGARA